MDLPLLKNAKDITGKTVLARIDVNVPIMNGKAQDDFRIRRFVSTLTFLMERAEKVILLSHHSDEKQTLLPVAHYVNKFFKTTFVKDIFNMESYKESDSLFLCENLRFYTEEKDNDAAFAKKLASLGDIYVNDAFAASHRAHASIVSLPKFLPHYAGFLFEEEIKRLETAFNPPHPFLFILGGRKADTKLALAQKFIDIADNIFIGGAVVNNLFKAKGYEVGISTVERVSADLEKIIGDEKVMLPEDVIVQNGKGDIATKLPDSVLPDEKILDAGPKSLRALARLIESSAFVVWNGPLGVFENGFEKSTIDMIHMFKKSKAKTIVGGGDSVAAISKFGDEKDFWFVSTGGGAMLDFLVNRTLPGIEALKI